MTRKPSRKAAAPTLLRVISPIDGSVYVEREAAGSDALHRCLAAARDAFPAWAAVPVRERARLCAKAARALLPHREEIALEITWQMGRPVRDSRRELDGLLERALYMTSIAEEALAELRPEPQIGFRRYIRREPLGVVLAIAPWNYPYLTAINVIVPALAAGNCVILKHSPQVPLCAERLGRAMQDAGIPAGVFQYVHCDHEGALQLIREQDGVDFVAFTGSVEGGHAIQRALADRFVGCGLELGGKDPAYVRADADLATAADGIIDGALFNAGQSCCAVERCYVHESVYDAFVREALERIHRYRLGDPRDPSTTLGPLVRTEAADRVRARIDAAVRTGARAHVAASSFPESRVGTPYLAPQLLTDVDHSMDIMREENFGPVLCVMRVRDDEDAIAHMNDSRYGLTASIWTRDASAAERIGLRLETGTVFMNRCDYLDPALAWTGVKDSGRGSTLSTLGYEQLTRPKSFHLRL